MKRVNSPQLQKIPRRSRGKLSKRPGGFVLRNFVHDFDIVLDEGVVYEISDDIFNRVERFINSQSDEYKN